MENGILSVFINMVTSVNTSLSLFHFNPIAINKQHRSRELVWKSSWFPSTIYKSLDELTERLKTPQVTPNYSKKWQNPKMCITLVISLHYAWKNDEWGLNPNTSFSFRYHFSKGENHRSNGAKQTQATFSFNKHLTNTRIKHTISRENEIKGKTVTKICSIHLNLFHKKTESQVNFC